MPEAISVGTFLVPTLRASVLLSLLLAVWAAGWVGKRLGLDASWTRKLAETGAWLGLLGARAGYVALNWGAFEQAPWTALYVWQPGYQPAAGLLAGAGYVLWRVWQRHAQERKRYLRALASGFALGALLTVAALAAMQIRSAPGVLRNGDSVPGFTLMNLQGERVSFSNLEGRAVVLNFWATWCPPCRREMPLLDSVQQKYGSRGLTIVGIDLDEPAAVVRAYVESIGVSYPIWVDAPANAPGVDTTRALYNRFGGIGLPTTFFIDRNGVIRQRQIGELNRAFLQNGIEAILPPQD
jgi:thiol-disulfide isomerase/thioredoxin